MILVDKNEESSSSSITEKFYPTSWNSVLFLMLGLSSGALDYAIYYEYPWFELSQPEGVNLILSMAMATSIGCILFFAYVRWDMWARPSVNTVAIWLTVVSTALTIIMSFIWHWSIKGTSYSILVFTCISCLISCLQWAVLCPWITTMDDPRYLSQFTAGESISEGINVFIEIAQQPGDAQNFSPDVYFLLMTLFLYVPAIWAIIYIVKKNIGNPTEFKGMKRESLIRRMFPLDAHKATYWMYLGQWNVLLTECVLPMIFPYIAYHTRLEHNGTNWLQWAYAVSAIAGLVGSLGATMAKEGCYYLTETTFLMTAVFIPLGIAGSGFGNFNTPYSRTFLQVCLAMLGALSGWHLPLVYRDLAEAFPDRESELSSYLSYWMVVMAIATYGIGGLLPYVHFYIHL